MENKHCESFVEAKEDESAPKLMPFEHWEKDANGKHHKLHQSYEIKEKMVHEDFHDEIFVLLNNHMKKTWC